jgi:hypothetical protein
MDRCPHGLILSQQSCHQCESARATGSEHKVRQLQAELEQMRRLMSGEGSMQIFHEHIMEIRQLQAENKRLKIREALSLQYTQEVSRMLFGDLNHLDYAQMQDGIYSLQKEIKRLQEALNGQKGQDNE